MIKLLLIFVIIYFCFKVVKSTVKSLGFNVAKSSQVNTGHGNIENVMIQDPVCNVYFAKEDGVCNMIGGKELCFCSEKCRDKYLAAHE